nr:lmo0937 family membrane protein [uncultured Psychroserpens sp.]
MKLLTYIIVIGLIISWALGYFVFEYEEIIHVLLIFAIVIFAYSAYKNNSNDGNLSF